MIRYETKWLQINEVDCFALHPYLTILTEELKHLHEIELSLSHSITKIKSLAGPNDECPTEYIM